MYYSKAPAKFIQVTEKCLSRQGLANLCGVSLQAMTNYLKDYIPCDGDPTGYPDVVWRNDNSYYYVVSRVMKHLRGKWTSARFVPCIQQIEEASSVIFEVNYTNPEYEKFLKEVKEAKEHASWYANIIAKEPAKKRAEAERLAKELAQTLATLDDIPHLYVEQKEYWETRSKELQALQA